MKKDFTYSAFISYSSKDEKVAKALWKKLERYRLPAVLQKQYEDIPEKMHIFLDQGDIVPGDTVENALSRELADSKKLIVICSPNSAKSPYVELEVKNFLSLGHSPNDIIPYIIEGEVKRESLNNCYVPSLFGQTDKETINGVSVLRDGKWKAFVGVLANLLDVKFDEIYKREKVRRDRIIVALSGLGFLFTCFIGLVIWYVMPHTRYYRDYITKWGIPVGIYELNKKQVKQESEHYQITTQYGRPIKLVHSNNRGEPENQLHFLNHFNRPKIATYKYESGFLPFVSMKNWKLTSTCYAINSGDMIDGDKDYTILLEYNKNIENENSYIIDFYYGKGNKERKSLSNNYLLPSCFYYSELSELFPENAESPEKYFFEDVSSIFQYRVFYDVNGYESEVRFYNYNNNPVKDKNGIEGFKNEFDPLGRIKKEDFIGDIAISIPKFVTNIYDAEGHLVKMMYNSAFNNNGAKVEEFVELDEVDFNIDHSGNAKNKIKSDVSNAISSLICYIDNKFRGYSYYKTNKNEISFFDSNNNKLQNKYEINCIQKNNSLKKEFDAHGRVVYEKNSEDIECRIIYKGNNCSIEYTKSGIPYEYLDYAQANFNYDNNNNLISCDFKDYKNNFVKSQFGFSKYEAKFNLIGLNLYKKLLNTEDAFIDSDRLGFSAYFALEDYSHNYLLEEYYFNSIGQFTTPENEGYSFMKTEKNGKSRTHTYFDGKRKNKIKHYLDEELHSIDYFNYLSTNLYKKMSADRYGRLIESSYYNMNDLPVNQPGTKTYRKTVDYESDKEVVRFFNSDAPMSYYAEMINFYNSYVDYSTFYPTGIKKSLMKNDSNKRTYFLEEYSEDGKLQLKSDFTYYSDDSFLRKSHDYILDVDMIEYRDKNHKCINGPEMFSAMSYRIDQNGIMRKVVLKADKEGNLSSLSNLSGKIFYISDIKEGSRAHELGVQKYDVLFELNNYKYFPCGSETELTNALQQSKDLGKNVVIYRPSEEKFYNFIFESEAGFWIEDKYAGNSIEESDEYINLLKKTYDRWKEK